MMMHGFIYSGVSTHLLVAEAVPDVIYYMMNAGEGRSV